MSSIRAALKKKQSLKPSQIEFTKSMKDIESTKIFAQTLTPGTEKNY